MADHISYDGPHFRIRGGETTDPKDPRFKEIVKFLARRRAEREYKNEIAKQRKINKEFTEKS